MKENAILWTPSSERVERSAMHRFMRANDTQDYASLHAWSVDRPEAFWRAMCTSAELLFSRPARRVLNQPGDISTARWFEDAEISFAANLLQHTGDHAAIVFRGENGSRRELSFDQLRGAVAGLTAALTAVGVVPGDRVAGFLPNCPEAVIAMLATNSLGAIWSSCSPDFGINGVVDRFGQIEPKVLFCADGYFYNGKKIDSLTVVGGILTKIRSIEKVVVVPFTGDEVATKSIRDSVLWTDFAQSQSALECNTNEFNHPLYIMYSSGTTGVPKCIVHGAGGTLLQHAKEHRLHCDIGADDRVFYFTTCGWMMWNWLVSALATGATIVLYDGAPFYADGRVLWEMAEEEELTIFGTSARYLAALQKSDVRPVREFSLTKLRTILSTGSVLAPESFDFVYEAVSNDVQLSSMSGGTDIIGCFAGANPLLPVRRGELQCLALGMQVEVYTDDARSVTDENGELVCSNAFPSMPLGFWNDPQREKYHAAYFERFPGVWAQGDFAEITAHGGMVIHGRSDAVLNPGGVRIGTAEIYRQVEKLDDVLESIAVGQEWDDDVRIVLFVQLRAGVQLDDTLRDEIRTIIRDNATPRHVPAKIIAVAAIPRTISGKIVELAVRDVIHGRPVRNQDALANPEALTCFENLQELNVE